MFIALQPIYETEQRGHFSFDPREAIGNNMKSKSHNLAYLMRQIILSIYFHVPIIFNLYNRFLFSTCSSCRRMLWLMKRANLIESRALLVMNIATPLFN